MATPPPLPARPPRATYDEAKTNGATSSCDGPRARRAIKDVRAPRRRRTRRRLCTATPVLSRRSRPRASTTAPPSARGAFQKKTLETAFASRRPRATPTLKRAAIDWPRWSRLIVSASSGASVSCLTRTPIDAASSSSPRGGGVSASVRCRRARESTVWTEIAVVGGIGAVVVAARRYLPASPVRRRRSRVPAILHPRHRPPFAPPPPSAARAV